MPVWKRPPVSVANRLCHPKGSRVMRFTRICADKRRRLARIIVWCCFVSGAGWLFLKDWIPGQASLPGMTRCIVWGCLFWAASTINTSPRHHLTTKAPFHHFTFPPQKHLSTFPPQKHLSTFKDPVIRVLFLHRGWNEKPPRRCGGLYWLAESSARVLLGFIS